MSSNASTARSALAHPCASVTRSLLFGLEQNWVGGEVGTNTHILNTLSTAAGVVARLEASSDAALSTNWRLQMYLYRAYCAHQPD